LEEDILAQGADPEVRDGVIRLWIRGLAGYMATMGRKGVEDLMAEYKTLRDLKSGDGNLDLA